MKKILSIISVLALFGISACTGPIGPRGPQGPQGNDGLDGLVGFVMEWDNVDFTATNNYEVQLQFSDFDFGALQSDVVLVYFLWDVQDGLEVWRQLPQTIIKPEGIVQYNFDFTTGDVFLFMDADFDLNILGAGDTDDWVVRVVVVPGEFVNGRMKKDITYEEAKVLFELPELPTPVSVRERAE